MRVDEFTLRFAGGKSFYALVDGEKISVVDAFCVLESGALPVCVGMCSLSVKMQFDRAEEGRKQIRISFVDEDGKPAMPSLETTMEVKIPGQTANATVPFAFLIQQLSLPAFGQYSVDLAVEGRLEASVPLYVRQKG